MEPVESKGKESRAAYWREQVRACASSGMSIAGYCRAHGLAVERYHWWKGELKRRELLAERSLAPSFAEVRVVSSAIPAAALIEVELSGGRRIGVRPGFDGATLSAVVRVLEGLEC